MVVERRVLPRYRLPLRRAARLLLLVAAIWGASVVADSAQFSTCVTELGDPRYIGTALTVQTCLGFLLTTVSIQLIPLARLCGRLALRLRRARPRPRARHTRHAPPPPSARSVEDRAR